MMDFHRIDSLEDIDDFYHNIKKSLILRERCIIVGECAEKRFLHFNQEEIRYFFKKHHQYSELNCVFNVLGLIESRFKIDFEKRISARQDNLYKSLSNQFKLLKAKNNDSFIPIRKILDVWEEETPHFTLIKSYNDWLKFRNWFAHGRYIPIENLDKYDYPSVRDLALQIFSTLPFLK